MFLSVSSNEDLRNRFNQYQHQYEKTYSLEEVETRFQNFKSNWDKINAHNSKPCSNFTMGINQFSDLSEKEFKEKYTGGFKTGLTASSCSKFGSSGKTIPLAIDWTMPANKYSTAVKDQGYCGSCWAFSAVETIESAWAIKKGQLLTLSEQQLVDCSKKYGNMACNGGLMDNAFHHVIDNGICSEESYPYTSGKSAQSGACQSCSSVASLISCADVTPNNQIALAEAVAQGPVSIAIQADSSIFQSYKSGIITSPTCGTTLDHGVVIVGYGTENTTPYWKVRNSWSSSWGEAGYVRILKSSGTNDIGICGVAAQPSFPIV